MRRSFAPSFRSVNALTASNSRSSVKDGAQPVRSTANILSLLSKQVQPQTVVSEKEDKLIYKEEEKEKPELHNKEVSETVPIKSFNIVYGKPSKKKHKTWDGDGILKIIGKSISVFDEEGKSIGTLAISKAKDVIEGARFFVGSKEIEIIEEIVSNSPELKRKAEPSVSTCIVKRPKTNLGKNRLHPQIPAEKLVLPEPSAEHQWNFSSGRSVTAVAIDNFLIRLLRPHQRVGVVFLYECVMGFKGSDISGAILADEMGLGKTLQCLALIWTLLRQGPYGKPCIKRVLIVTPSSLTGNWAAEFKKWLGRERIIPFVIDSKNKPTDIHINDKVIIVSYEMLLRHRDAIGDDFDLLICDEAHRLKNTETKISQALSELCPSMRILLTGTPIQNDLQEFFALVDFANPNCVGSASSFKRQYEDVIVAGRQPNAPIELQELGEERASELNQLTSRFILRRTRAHIDSYLPGKNEVVVFCRPSAVQQHLYNSVVDSLGDLTGFDGSYHLAVISTLRKVSSHPALLSREIDDESTEIFNYYNTDNVNNRNAPENSGKMLVVVSLLSQLWAGRPRERIVLVSNFTQTLNLIEDICQQYEYPILRLDGSTPAAQRSNIVDRFNSDANQFVFLLSAKAGGVGLNLIGASRLVLFDSDWNPATDLQAMARIWRDGQKRDVYIYRLLTVGTIDEKMFQRQLSKQTLAGGIVDATSSSTVQMSREELMDIFAYCDENSECLTHKSLGCDCDGSGAIPYQVESKENRPCQLVKNGNSSTSGAMRMEELMGWSHHAPPFNDNFIDLMKLRGCDDVLQFIFSTKC